jgi:putative DNA primase/helicase
MSFTLFARAHGVEIADLYPSDRIRRCPTTEKPRSTNGAYFWDGERGWVFAWDGEAKVQWYEDPQAKPWTEAEKAAWRAKRNAAGADIAKAQQRAAQVAAEMLRAAKPANHNYLHFKGFPDAQGFVAEDGALLIPMRGLTGDLQGVQRIVWVEADRAYDKKMQPFGMKAKGAVFRMGDKTAPETFLCEGYATGLSIIAALRSVGLRASVLVCFSANNLATVAPMVRGKVFVFADNDKSEAGEKAALQTNLPYCMSPVVGEDANDLHVRAGLMAVCQQLMAVRRLEQAMA